MNVGRNGKYHSARGVLYLAYPYVQAINRLRNAALDSTAYSMALFLQAPDAESMEDMAIVLNGPSRLHLGVDLVGDPGDVLERTL